MPDTPASPRFPDPGDLGGVFDDFPLDANLRELYLRLRLDGAVWRSQQPEDDARLLAYVNELAAEAPAFVTTPTFDEPRAAPVTRDLRANARRRRLHALLGDARVAIVAALIVALVSVTLLQISPLALRSKAPRVGSGVTPLPTLTATATATATPSPAPTATRTPTRAATPRPTISPPVAFIPYLATLSNGETISETLEQDSIPVTCSPNRLYFQVQVKFMHSVRGSFTYAWQFYDGSTAVSLLQLFSVGMGNQNAIIGGMYTTPIGEIPQPSTVVPIDTYLTLTQPSQYSSTPRWGAQFLITQINGRTLATPIVSPVMELPAPAC